MKIILVEHLSILQWANNLQKKKKKAQSALLSKGYTETKRKEVLNKYSSPVSVEVNCLGWY